jgi:hypothetical protein
MIPASIESIAPHSCSDAANPQGLTFGPSSVLRILSGFERSGLITLEVPRRTELISADAFAASKPLVSLRFSSPPAICEIDGFRACGLRTITIPAAVEVIDSNGFPKCLLLHMVFLSHQRW